MNLNRMLRSALKVLTVGIVTAVTVAGVSAPATTSAQNKGGKEGTTTLAQGKGGKEGTRTTEVRLVAAKRAPALGAGTGR